MQDLLTPKQVARAIQVSESSVKRWCDKGVIATQYTAGGHRRIPVGVLLDFLRSTKHVLIRPEVLGLPAATGRTRMAIERATAHLVNALLHGQEDQCRQILLDLYLSEHSISLICDQVIAKSFQDIGERWECGQAEVYQERLGCEIAQRVLYELRSFLPAPAEDAPLAIGGAVEGDQYNLATTMVELVLRDAKWDAVSLGDNLPFDSLSAAIKAERPKLFWLSCSHIPDAQQFVEDYGSLYDQFGLDVAFVVGGRALTPEVRESMKYAAYCDNMQHVEGFALSLRGAAENP